MKEISNDLKLYFERVMKLMESTIDLFDNNIWNGENIINSAWKHAYHALYYADYWLNDNCSQFKNYFNDEEELNKFDSISTKVISIDNMMKYYQYVQLKSLKYIESLDDNSLGLESEYGGKKLTPLKKILGQIRHVSVHIGFMQSILTNNGHKIPDWT